MGTGKRAGKGHPQAQSVWESKGSHKNTAGDVQKLQNTWAKSIAAAQGKKTANVNPKLPKHQPFPEEKPKSDLKD